MEAVEVEVEVKVRIEGLSDQGTAPSFILLHPAAARRAHVFCRDSMNKTPECPVPKRAKPQRQAQGRLQLRRLRSSERAAIDSLTGPEPHGLQVGPFQLPVGARLLQRHSETLVDVVGLRQASPCTCSLGAYYSCTTYLITHPTSAQCSDDVPCCR